MKFGEYVKSKGLSYMEFRKYITNFNLSQYSSPNKVVTQTDLPKLEECAENFAKQQESIDLEKEEVKKGSFIGAVYHEKGGEFLSVTFKLTYQQMIDIGIEFEVIEKHTTIHGALIKLHNSLKRYINELTVKRHGQINQ